MGKPKPIGIILNKSRVIRKIIPIRSKRKKGSLSNVDYYKSVSQESKRLTKKYSYRHCACYDSIFRHYCRFNSFIHEIHCHLVIPRNLFDFRTIFLTNRNDKFDIAFSRVCQVEPRRIRKKINKDNRIDYFKNNKYSSYGTTVSF